MSSYAMGALKQGHHDFEANGVFVEVKCGSSSSNVSSFYVSDVEIFKAVMLDRSSFLDSVTDAVTYEDKNSDATKMISILSNNAFLSLMPALLTDADINIRNKAYLALGNLIASNNRDMSVAALNCAYKALTDKKFVFTTETSHGIAFILTNMAMRYARWAQWFPNANVNKNDVLLYAEEHLTADLPASVKRDLLWVFKELKSHFLLEPTLLITLLEQQQKKTFSTALRFLGDIVSDDKFFESHCFMPTYNYLRGMLLKNEAPFGTTLDHLWMLSNLVTESGMGLTFLQDYDLFEAVTDRIRHSKENLVVSEAVWVLLNSLVHVDLKDLSHFCVLDTHDVILDFLRGNRGTPIVRKEAPLACSKLMDFITTRYLPADDVEDVEEDEEYEDEEEIWYPATASEEAAHPPCEISGFTLYNPPSAADLLQKRIVRGVTSAAVFNLVQILEANNLQFTPIPDDMALTAEDLKALETRGYAISGGRIGINPVLSMAFYGMQ